MTTPEEDRSIATAASSPLKFADGTTYEMAPFSDKDIAEMDEWVQSHFIEVARKSLGSECTQAEREETLSIAMRTAQGLSWMSGPGLNLMKTVDGMTRLTWQAVKTNHPGVTQDDIRKHMFSPENVDAARRKFEKLNNRKKTKKQRGKKRAGNRQRRKKSTKR